MSESRSRLLSTCEWVTAGLITAIALCLHLVRVRSAGEAFYYVGDLFHLPCEVEHHDWVPAGRDQAAMRASRGRLVADAVPERATLVFTHEGFPAWGRIVRDPGGYRWERAW